MKAVVARSGLWGVLVLTWWALGGGSSAHDWGVGLAVALLISLLVPAPLSVLSGVQPRLGSVWAIVGFVVYFLRALLVSNLRMARIVLSPALPIHPAIVRVRTRLQHPVARLLLANSITLTPGTLTVDMEGPFLYVHCVDITRTGTEEATREIVAGLEHYLERIYA